MSQNLGVGRRLSLGLGKSEAEGGEGDGMLDMEIFSGMGKGNMAGEDDPFVDATVSGGIKSQESADTKGIGEDGKDDESSSASEEEDIKAEMKGLMGKRKPRMFDRSVASALAEW